MLKSRFSRVGKRLSARAHSASGKNHCGFNTEAEAQNEVTKPFSLSHFWPAPRPAVYSKYLKGRGYQNSCSNLSVIFPG